VLESNFRTMHTPLYYETWKHHVYFEAGDWVVFSNAAVSFDGLPMITRLHIGNEPIQVEKIHLTVSNTHPQALSLKVAHPLGIKCICCASWFDHAETPE
jgi:hypothetical protein